VRELVELKKRFDALLMLDESACGRRDRTEWPRIGRRRKHE
jgi:hypothetical protein